MRIDSRKLILWLLAIICYPGMLSGSQPAESLNILFIAVDDLRPELGCYGNADIQSPNIDALAEKSLLFKRAYCQQAVCNPSRVSLLTGMRPDSTKVWDLVTQFRDVAPDLTTFPQHFKRNGYRALGYGKIFHNPWPDNVSWSEPHQWPRDAQLWSSEAKADLAAFKKQLRLDGRPERLINRLRARATEQVDLEDHEHIDGAIANQAIEALRQLANQDPPFFLAAGFVRPHLPFVVPQKYWDIYDRNRIPLAENAAPPQDAPAYAMNTMYELRDYYDFLETPAPLEGALTQEQQRELKHGYYAAVSFVDAQIGRLLGELDRLQLRDKTVIVLWGDHGWKLGEHRSWCKQTNYEIDTRIPLLISVPQNHPLQTTGTQCDAIVESLDIFPTLCELAGLTCPEQLEGVSLVPLLQQNDVNWHNRAISQFPRHDGKRELMGYALRSERYRYIEWLDRNTCGTVATELYDHEHDPQENQNRSNENSHKQIVAEQSQLLWETIKRPEPGDLAKPEIQKQEVIPTRP
ncbi:MAG: sulfatase [Planctomycetaceae bacterium]|nr:sulfatase [Planctomycetaceae bacterium]